MADDASPHTHVMLNLPRFLNISPRITLLHSLVDSAFAARLARALLGMYGTASIRLTDGADASSDASFDGANPESDTREITLAVLSPEALATPDYTELLRKASPRFASAPNGHTAIGVIVRGFIPPPELTGWRLISFEEDWRYELALAELLDGIRSAIAVEVAVPTVGEQAPVPDAFVPRVFVSHSSADNAFGLDLERQLQEALGDPEAVFYDRDGGLIGGDEWMGRLQHKISDSNVFVLLLSPQAFDSPWVQKELRMALRAAVSSEGKVIIPVLHRETPVWPFLEDYQFVRYVWPRPPDEAFVELLATVKLGRSRMDEVSRMRLGRPGPPFDIDLLPLPGRFVGRGADIEWVLGRLDPETPQLVDPGAIASIAAANGLPGIGKSALAGYVAHILYATNQFPDGIAVVLCNGLNDPADVLSQALARFDSQGRKPTEHDMQALRDLARRTFAGRQALVVLDNVEPEWPIWQVVAPLRVAGAAVLLTSRVRLPARAVPPEASRMLELLSPEEALDLFAEYYGRGRKLDLTLAEQKQVARIVKALGYHTLAVKLAAARAQGRDLEGLARAYETDPRLGVHLKDGAEAVAVVLASSVAELPEHARRLFAALGAFATGDIGRGALLAIAEGLDDSEPETSVDAIVDLRLVDAYVASELPHKADRERIRLHPLIQAFAREKFAIWKEDTRDKVQRAVAAWYATYTRSTPDLALATDEENIVAALVYLQERHAGAPDEDIHIADICYGTFIFWRDTGRIRAGLTYLPWGRAAAERVAERTSARGDHIRVADIAVVYGDILFDIGRIDEAEQAFQHDLKIRRQLNDRRGEAATLSRMGNLARLHDQLEQAQSYFEQALALRREVQDRANEAVDLGYLGDVAGARNQLEQAQSYYEQALAITRDVHDRQGEGVNLKTLGDVAFRRGHLEVAESYYEQALAIANEIQDRKGEGAARTALGNVARQRGDLEAAESYYEQALAIANEIQDLIGESAARTALGNVAFRRGHLEVAESYYEQALMIDREVRDRKSESFDLTKLGDVARQRGELEKAQGYYEQALTVDQELRDRREEGIDLTRLGDVARDRGELEEAMGYYEQALTIDRELQNRSAEGDALSRLAQIAQTRGRVEEAEEFLQDSLIIRRELNNRAGEAFDLTRLGYLEVSRNQLEKAETYYEQALAIQRELGDSAATGNILITLAQIAQIRGQPEAAEHAYQQALTIATELDDNGAMASILVELGNLFYANDRKSEALSAYERAISLEAGNAAAWSGLGNALDDLERHEEAVEAYDRSLALAPEEAIVWRNKAGVLLENLKQYDEALAAAEHALALESTSIRGWMLKGLALQGLSRDDEAHAALEHAVAIEPDSDVGWTSRGRALAALARSDEALVAYDEALKFDPEDKDVWELKAESLRALGRENEAQKADAHAHPPDA